MARAEIKKGEYKPNPSLKSDHISTFKLKSGLRSVLAALTRALAALPCGYHAPLDDARFAGKGNLESGFGV